MKIDENAYLEEILSRITYYSVISHEAPEVFFKSFQVLKHPDKPKHHYLHLKYVMMKDDDLSVVDAEIEEIETFVRADEIEKRGWKTILRQDDPKEISNFLSKTTKADDLKIKIDIKIRGHELKEQIQQD